ncbi:MAG TPA: helix-turn-helix domain-containing protein [Blastocatellia bacterium]|nr:helix-turn-helix domain-containing protein [Blastocatellia bacterium]
MLKRSTQTSTNVENVEFVTRLIEACGTDEPAEIQRKVGLSYQGAKNYLSGRLPKAEELMKIANSTDVSIHWLLTGEGPKERTIVKAIKDGVVNLDEIRRDALIEYFLDEAKNLLRKEKRGAKGLNRASSDR